VIAPLAGAVVHRRPTVTAFEEAGQQFLRRSGAPEILDVAGQIVAAEDLAVSSACRLWSPRSFSASASTGRYSLDDLYQRCLNDGFRTPGSTSAIPRSKVEYLLKNPFHIGQFRWKKRLYKGAREPIVSRELFDKVLLRFEGAQGRNR